MERWLPWGIARRFGEAGNKIGAGAVFLTALRDQRPPGAISFCFSFYRHSLFGTTSGGHIFLCVKKDMEERHAKGLQSRPLESGFYTGVWRGDVRTLYVFALVQFTRFRPVRGVWQAHCFHGLDCTARNAVGSKHSLNNQCPANLEVGWLRKCHQFNRIAARRAHGSSALVHAMRDLIASNALLRARRKSPWGKVVGTQHVRMAQTITPGDSRGRQQGPHQSPTLVGLVGRGGATE